MTIKQAQFKMIQTIRAHYIRNCSHRITDKEIAKELQIAPTTFSRLYTGVQTADIMTWFKLTKIYKQITTFEEWVNFIKEVEA